MRIFKVLIATAVLSCALPVLAQEPRLVSVGDHRLEVRVQGSGRPAVVIQAGFGGDASHWQHIQESIAEFTTAITYSRPGYGNSEASPSALTPMSVASDLRELLRALGTEGPVVLVGHSWGGLLVRVFAAQYPDDVAGLVLIDGSHERQYQELALLSPTFWEDTRPSMDESAARVGGAAPAELEVMWNTFRRGVLPEAYPIPDVPMAVITNQQSDPSWIGGTEAGLALWRELNHEYFLASSDGVHFVSAQTGHNVHRDRPDLVISAIRYVVDASLTQER